MDLDVVMPFHRVDSFFFDAVNSVKKSEGVRVNLILVDDRAPGKNSMVKVQDNFPFVNILRTKGAQGYGAALRVAASALRTDAVALFNSDDIVHPQRFIKQLKSLSKNDISHCGVQRISKDGKFVPSLAGNFNSKIYDPNFLLLGAYGANATWLMTRDWWMENVFFDSDECLDWRIALSTFSKTKISYLPEKLYFYRKHENQVTARNESDLDTLQPLFIKWTEFAKLNSFGSYSFETFKFFAMPWLKIGKIEIEEIEEFAQKILLSARTKDTEISDGFMSLIQRRYIFGIKNTTSFRNKFKLVSQGKEEIRNIASDMALNFLTRSSILNHVVNQVL